METKELKIAVPKGYEIDNENSTFECIKFKPIEKELPKTWREFCEGHPIKDKEFFVQSNGLASTKRVGDKRMFYDTGYLPNEEAAKAMLALCQLIQLRDCYNNGWKPDWSCNTCQSKYTIFSYFNEINTSNTFCISRILAFKSAELRDQFLDNFRDLIEIAKPLL